MLATSKEALRIPIQNLIVGTNAKSCSNDNNWVISIESTEWPHRNSVIPSGHRNELPFHSLILFHFFHVRPAMTVRRKIDGFRCHAPCHNFIYIFHYYYSMPAWFDRIESMYLLFPWTNVNKVTLRVTCNRSSAHVICLLVGLFCTSNNVIDVRLGSRLGLCKCHSF